MVVQGQIGFFVDATKCINCKTCEVACKDLNDTAPGQNLRKVHAFEGGEFPRVFVWNLSMSCNHCENPLCVEHCPAGAYTKRPGDGIVVHDATRCIGCRYCTWVCPYGAPQYDAAEGRVRKCNLCVEEMDRGNSPACVTSCPMRAIEIGLLDELAARPGATIAISGLPSPEITRPACRYKVRTEARNV
jgi:anaerobic dimethyl sulfoxide reductase subunit B